MSTTSTRHDSTLRHELCRIFQFFLKKQMKPKAVPYFMSLRLLLLLLCFVATGGDATLSSESIGARVLFLRLVSAIVFFSSKIHLFLFLLFFCCFFSIVVIFYSKNEPELDDGFHSCPTTGPTGPEITKSGRRESQQEHRHVLLMLLLSCPFAIDEFQ